jgi:hypothetical protein
MTTEITTVMVDDDKKFRTLTRLTNQTSADAGAAWQWHIQINGPDLAIPIMDTSSGVPVEHHHKSASEGGFAPDRASAEKAATDSLAKLFELAKLPPDALK